MRLELYPHQQECLAHAKCKNTIVNLPTGQGKTLIAVKMIDFCLQLQPTKRVAFVVPTRPLVQQQADYCKEHCRVNGLAPVIQRLVGTEQADWQKLDWDECIKKSHILVGTPALFQQAFVTDKYIDIGRFCLIIFDECHNAVGNSPMAAVMRDGIAPRVAKGLPSPRILGLTASIINGSLQGMEKKRRNLEALLNSTIICPHIEPRLAEDKFKFVSWMQPENIDQQKQVIAKHIEEAIKHAGKIKEMRKMISKCAHVFEELGSKALKFYVDKVIVEQIENKATLLKEIDDTGSVLYAQSLLDGLPALREGLDIMVQNLKLDPAVKQTFETSWKLQRLSQLIRELFTDNEDGYRGIVFVEQVALVSSLAKQLNDELTLFGIRCGAVAGTGTQSENDRQDQLQKFKRGELQILVATPTLEEGIDVSACAFVVRYTSVKTTKAIIQGSGRARDPHGLVYYFENDPVLERQKLDSMTAIAKDKSLSLDPNELKHAMSSMSVSINQRHPYPCTLSGRASMERDSGQVNVFNCMQIFNQYCSSTLGVPIQPRKVLYEYTIRPGHPEKVLSSIRFPTPDGWKRKTQNDYNSFWTGVDLSQVLTAERIKRKSSSEKEEMLFVYLIVVELREKGFLDNHNKTEPNIRFNTKRSCPLSSDESSSSIRIKNSVFQSYKQSSSAEPQIISPESSLTDDF